MSTLSIILIGLWCILIGLYSGIAALHYNIGNISDGIVYTAGAMLWATAIILRVIHPA